MRAHTRARAHTRVRAHAQACMLATRSCMQARFRRLSSSTSALRQHLSCGAAQAHASGVPQWPASPHTPQQGTSSSTSAASQVGGAGHGRGRYMQGQVCVGVHMMVRISCASTCIS